MPNFFRLFPAAVITFNAATISSCATQSSTQIAASQPPEALVETMMSLESILNKNQQQVQLKVNQPLWINLDSHSKGWRVNVSRHDYPKVDLEIDPQKMQRKIKFKSPGKYLLTLTQLATQNISNGSTAPAAANVMQQQLTVLVKED